MKSFFSGLCAFFLMFSFICKAEEAMVLEEILVTATKTEQEIQKTGSSVTVITREEIESGGYMNVAEALEFVPGIKIARQGGFGGMTNVFIRGAKPEHTLVMIDGVVVNDPISPGRAFDFAHIKTYNIERIEVVRGPQSTLYGSDAMSGVINIITARGREGMHLDFSLFGGTYNTFGSSLGISGGKDKIDYSFNMSLFDTQGFPKSYGGSEDDGYTNLGVSTRIGYELTEDTELSFVISYQDAEFDLDSYDFWTGGMVDNPDYTATWKKLSSNLSFLHAVNKNWDYRLSFAYAETEREEKDEPNAVDAKFKGDTRKFEWQNNFYPSDNHIITAGTEYQEERGLSKGDFFGPVDFPERKVNTRSLYLQDQIVFADSLYLTPGLRIDDHEMFGTETTYRIAASYIIENTGTRLKGSFGTGFKAPTLYQLYAFSDFVRGNPNLEPEKTTGFDLGFEQGFRDDRFLFGATYFSSRYENMIDTVFVWTGPDPWDGYFEYRNFQEAEASGFEIEAKYRPFKRLSLNANYTYLDTEDRETGRRLQRRPKHKIGLNAFWQATEKTGIALNFVHVGERTEDRAGTIMNKAYTRVDLNPSYRVNENLSLFARIENILDEDYQEILGYSAPGRSFYAGLKGSF